MSAEPPLAPRVGRRSRSGGHPSVRKASDTAEQSSSRSTTGGRERPSGGPAGSDASMLGARTTSRSCVPGTTRHTRTRPAGPSRRRGAARSRSWWRSPTVGSQTSRRQRRGRCGMRPSSSWSARIRCTTARSASAASSPRIAHRDSGPGRICWGVGLGGRRRDLRGAGSADPPGLDELHHPPAGLRAGGRRRPRWSRRSRCGASSRGRPPGCRGRAVARFAAWPARPIASWAMSAFGTTTVTPLGWFWTSLWSP